MRRFRIYLALGVLAMPSPLRAQEAARLLIVPPTHQDIAAAMQDSAQLFGSSYISDGTARGDSTRRFAALGISDLEGGDRARGMRLVHAARERGLIDSTFYLQAGLMLRSLRAPAEALAMFKAAAERWPDLVWVWDGQAHALRDLGRAAEAKAAERRAAKLRSSP
jgi:tetratricopeptide (TPR) repeat protein